jgi:hypothetical protein
MQGAGQSRPFLFGDDPMPEFCIAYPAETHAFGPLPRVVGMSRSRQILHPAIIRKGHCPVVLADTPEKTKALDAAMLALFRASNPDAVCLDPAQWLTLPQILQAAREAGCAVKGHLSTWLGDPLPA